MYLDILLIKRQGEDTCSTNKTFFMGSLTTVLMLEISSQGSK